MERYSTKLHCNLFIIQLTHKVALSVGVANKVYPTSAVDGQNPLKEQNLGAGPSPPTEQEQTGLLT